METNKGNPSKTRWYEKEENVALSVNLMESFPLSHEPLIGETLSRLAEKHCQVSQFLKNPRTLPPEKVLSLFKAKSKARSYDKVESLHHAMNCLYVLPETQRTLIATHVITVVDHLMEYFAICQHTNQPVDNAIMQGITDSFVAGNFKNTVAHLSTFYPSMTLPNGPTMQAIRNQLNQSKAKAYAEELATWRQSLGEAEKAKSPAVESESGNESKPPPKKDETVALGNRDMKIKLDKLDL